MNAVRTKTNTPPPTDAAPAPAAGDNRLAVATSLIAKARAECADLGLTPGEFANLLLPEVLLAMMVDGMTQEEVEDAFARFAQKEIGDWFMRVKRVAGYCDCEREARADHAAHCASRRVAGVAPIKIESPHAS